jgi:hypothetical protein
MAAKPGDKRARNRAKRRIMVRYGLGTADKTGFTKDLSDTGMFLKTNQAFKPGTTIQVQIQFPKETISMWARVVWAKVVPQSLAHVLECGMGIAFIDPTDDWKAFFQEWKQKAGVIDE